MLAQRRRRIPTASSAAALVGCALVSLAELVRYRCVVEYLGHDVRDEGPDDRFRCRMCSDRRWGSSWLPLVLAMRHERRRLWPLGRFVGRCCRSRRGWGMGQCAVGTASGEWPSARCVSHGWRVCAITAPRPPVMTVPWLWHPAKSTRRYGPRCRDCFRHRLGIQNETDLLASRGQTCTLAGQGRVAKTCPGRQHY